MYIFWVCAGASCCSKLKKGSTFHSWVAGLLWLLPAKSETNKKAKNQLD
jgi:hypothetical protein